MRCRRDHGRETAARTSRMPHTQIAAFDSLLLFSVRVACCSLSFCLSQVYRRGVDEKGETSDRLKAFHHIEGVSARELCSYFYDTKFKLEWERKFLFCRLFLFVSAGGRIGSFCVGALF